MVKPVSLRGFQKGFQGVSLRGFRGFQIFLWELCVCIKYLSLGDPCCGSGGMFVQSARFVQNHSGNINSISVFGQEANATTRKMALMNLAIRGIEANLGPHQADTFINDLHPTLKADFVMAIIWSQNHGIQDVHDEAHNLLAA